MSNKEQNKNYYAIIPAVVRYDEELTANAKLLYGEITALSNEKGYCWANNNYFANLYKVSNRSVSTWINQLIKKGYINSEIIYRDNSKYIIERKLTVNDTKPQEENFNRPIEENFHTPRTKLPYPIEENFNRPIEENFQDNNTSINNTFNKDILPPSKPKKTIYGEFKKVSLSEEEYQKLVESLGQTVTEEFITRLDIYKASTGKTYKSDYATILNWNRKESTKQVQAPTPTGTNLKELLLKKEAAATLKD